DAIRVLAPIGRAFGLTYVLKLVVAPAPATLAEVEALDFSGLDGPREVHYRVSSLPQLDDFSFVDLRLYLIARGRQAVGQSGVEALEPQNYLDLTSIAARPGSSGSSRACGAPTSSTASAVWPAA